MKIILYGHYTQNTTPELMEEILQFFINLKTDIYIEECFLNEIQTVANKQYPVTQFASNTTIDASFNYLISIGGDGTVLRSATVVKDSGVPILAINTGRLGFLANTPSDSVITSLQQLIEKRYTLSPRTLLELRCTPEPPEFAEMNYALNEVTVSRKDTTSMITINTSLNDEYLTSYWADGLIISTPTGSTGYSLSCGGPVLTPEAACLVVNPIAPHNLNARPLVITDDTEITLQVSGRENQFLVSLDSRIAIIDQSTILTIKKKPFKINMIILEDESFLKTLRNKLLWGEDKRN